MEPCLCKAGVFPKFRGCPEQQNNIHPQKLTWNLETMVSNRNLLFQGSIFRFHVCFGGCIYLDPPFWCQISAPNGLCLVVFWGPNFRPDWRIQVYIFIEHETTCVKGNFWKTLQVAPKSCREIWISSHPGKINMEPENHSFATENHFPNLH